MTPRNNNRKRKKKGSKPQDNITKVQYERGWSLVSTYHTAQQVITATSLTRPQLVWLTRIGSKKMLSYNERMTEEIAAIRQRATNAAEQVGKDALVALQSAGTITHRSQDIVKSLMGAYMMRLQGSIKQAQISGSISATTLSGLGMPKSLRETLRVLKPYTDFSETARAFRLVFDSPLQERNPLKNLPKALQGDLAGEATMPAAMALVEELGGDNTGHDALDDLLPEFKNWTDEEIEYYASTGERPPRDFGNDTPIPVSVPEVIDVPSEVV